MIELRNLSKSYKTRSGIHRVIDDISMVIPDRANLGILGRNGEGKSTLLRLIGGVEIPDCGEVLHTKPVSWPIGFGGGFNGSLTGRENTRFVARIYGQDPDEIAYRTLEFSELGDYFNMPMRTYSSGMRARLAFGLSMSIEFGVYLIDEITAVGDRPFQEKCRTAFQERKEQASVVIVSHQLKTIKEYADLFGVLRKGKLELFDDIDEATVFYQTI